MRIVEINRVRKGICTVLVSSRTLQESAREFGPTQHKRTFSRTLEKLFSVARDVTVLYREETRLCFTNITCDRNGKHMKDREIPFQRLCPLT